jgi:LPS sulfotransferase NodH
MGTMRRTDRRPPGYGSLLSDEWELKAGQPRHASRLGVSYGLSLAAWLARDTPRFVIATSGRTGSELLVSLLASHPDITCDGEVLMSRRAFPRRLVDGRAALARLRGARAYGFKLQPGHFRYIQMLPEPDSYPRRLHDGGWKVIRLRRRNLLHQALSSVRGKGTTYHHTRAEAGGFTTSDVDPIVVLATMAVIEEADAYLDRVLDGLVDLELVYEDDLTDGALQQSTVARICSLLNLPCSPTTSELVRITPRRARDMVTNYEELTDLLEGTRFERYLSD